MIKKVSVLHLVLHCNKQGSIEIIRMLEQALPSFAFHLTQELDDKKKSQDGVAPSR